MFTVNTTRWVCSAVCWISFNRSGHNDRVFHTKHAARLGRRPAPGRCESRGSADVDEVDPIFREQGRHGGIDPCLREQSLPDLSALRGGFHNRIDGKVFAPLPYRQVSVNRHIAEADDSAPEWPAKVAAVVHHSPRLPVRNGSSHMGKDLIKDRQPLIGFCPAEDEGGLMRKLGL